MSRLEIMVALIVIAVLVTLLLGRLGELNGMARPVRLQAAMASVRATAALFHARCESRLQREPGSDCARLEMDGLSMAGVHGWPAATTEGIGRLPIFAAGGNDAFKLRVTQAQGRPALSVRLGPACEFLYVQAVGPDVIPVVDIVDVSCH